MYNQGIEFECLVTLFRRNIPLKSLEHLNLYIAIAVNLQCQLDEMAVTKMYSKRPNLMCGLVLQLKGVHSYQKKYQRSLDVLIKIPICLLTVGKFKKRTDIPKLFTIPAGFCVEQLTKNFSQQGVHSYNPILWKNRVTLYPANVCKLKQNILKSDLNQGN